MVVKKMNQRTNSFNEGNLAIMGLYDTVLSLYIDLKLIYQSTFEQFNGVSLSTLQNIDEACRAHVRKRLERFLSSYTAFFTNEYEKLHINRFGLHLFSMLDVKRSTQPFHVDINIITFHLFLERLLIIIVRIISQRKNRSSPAYEFERVYQDVNNHITTLLNQYRKHILTPLTTKSNNEDNQLFLYSQFAFISCNQKKHKIVTDIHCAEKLDGSGYYNLPIHRCLTCGRKFVGKYTLYHYEKEFGKIHVETRKDLYNNNQLGFNNLKRESDLHSHGYNVASGQLSETERRNLLVNLMHSGKMTYFEISRDIKNAIHTQQHLHSRSSAVIKWKSDLEFLSKYMEKYLDP